MLYTLLNWLWIGISCLLVGYAGIEILNKVIKKPVRSISLSFFYGLCLLTVYAEYFSLVHKVGIMANIILIIVDVIILIFCKRNIIKIITEHHLLVGIKEKNNICKIAFLWIMFVVILLATSSSIEHYDTLLYHAQSIRWIEEYGIVKGLGNLHNRFAYNSSVFCLQALFSMPYVFGQSMHAVNGLVVFVCIAYSIVSLKGIKNQSLYVSDFMRLAFIICLNIRSVYKYASSAGSDILAISMFFYILIKAVSLIEEGEKETSEIAYLCILGVYAVSVKLSVAMIVLLVFIPLIVLIKNKRWAEMGVYFGMGIIVVLPFLIRNVIISGYLVYPYPQIDLFDVDWKMPKYTLLFDSSEIQAYGRGIKDVSLSVAMSLSEWFPIWLSELSYSIKIILGINIVLIPISIIWGLRRWKMNHVEDLVAVIVMISNLLLWFWGAPLIRYGLPFMLLLPFYMGAQFLSKCNKNRRIEKCVVQVIIACCFVFNINLMQYAQEQIKNEDVDLKLASDYIEMECEEQNFYNQKIYIPTSGDQSGYYAFPSTPYREMLELIEFRDDDIQSGFRIKEEYKNLNVPNNGNIAEINIFDGK